LFDNNYGNGDSRNKGNDNSEGGYENGGGDNDHHHRHHHWSDDLNKNDSGDDGDGSDDGMGCVTGMALHREDVESFARSSLLVAVPTKDTIATLAPTATTMHKVNVVVHTVVLSSPRLCQEDPGRAKAINVSVDFFDSVLASSAAALWSTTTTIIALLTDQVYDGKQEAKSYYSETEKEGLKPVNGQTKLEMEDYVMQKQQHPEDDDDFNSSSGG